MTFLDSFSKSQPNTGFAKSQPDAGFGGVLKGLRGITDALAENFARDPEIRASRKKARIDKQTREEIQENKRQKAGIERLRFLGKLAVKGFISEGNPVPDVIGQIGKSICRDIGGDLGEEECQIFLAQISQPPPGEELNLATGFEVDPDRPGAARPIVGGSQDPAILEAAAKGRAAGTAAGTPGAGKRMFQGTTAEGKEQQYIVDLEAGTVTPVGPAGIPQSVVAATPEALVGGQAAIRRLREQETSTRIVLGDITRMTQQLDEGKTFTSVVSGAVRGINSLVGTALQASSLLGFDDRPLLSKEYELGVFQEEAAKSATFRSNVIKLAYAVARVNDPRARLTDRDVQNALKQIGTDSGSKETIKATLNEVAQGAVRGFRAQFETMDRQSPGAFGSFPPDFDELLKPLSTKSAKEPEALPEGVPAGSKKLDKKTKAGEDVWETPDGELLVVF